MRFVFVALGGAAGAALRYAVSLLPAKGAFPLLTLLTNLAGAFVIGVIAGLAAKRNLPQNAVLFLKTGLCGGFTTFSTFSLEACMLLRSGRVGLCVLYMLLSVALCRGGVFGGLLLTGRTA